MGVPEWASGVIVAVTSATVINLGLTIQKYSHQQYDLKQEQQKTRLAEGGGSSADVKQAIQDMDPVATPTHTRPYTSDPLWRIGFAIFFSGQIGMFIALSLASQGLVATLGAFSLVANVFFAPFILKEQVGLTDYASAALIFAGCAIVVTTGDHSDQNYTLDDLLTLFKSASFSIFWFLLLAVLVVLYVVLLKLRQDPQADRRRRAAVTVCVAAICSANSIFGAKCTSVLIKTTLAGDNQHDAITTWLIGFGFAFFAISAVHLLNCALQDGEALVVAPMYYTLNTLLAVLIGLLFFQEYANLTSSDFALFLFGLCLTLVGVFLSAKRHEQHVAEAVDQQKPLMTSNTYHSLGDSESQFTDTDPQGDEDEGQPPRNKFLVAILCPGMA